MQAQILIIAGKVNSGKTSFAKRMWHIANRQSIHCCGFIAEGVYQKGIKYAYQLIDLENNNKFLCCSEKPLPNSIKINKFYFDRLCLQEGNTILAKQHPSGSFLFIDEIGPMELSGKVWAPGLKTALEQHKGPLILVMRQNLIRQICRYFKIDNILIIDIEQSTPEEALETIKNAHLGNSH